ncbi:MAG: hypothetical protein WCP28_16670 [Actinomycetes bacterium]
MRTYTATARKDGKWWVIQCVEHPGAISQVTRLGNAADIHREAIAFVTDVPVEEIDVTVQPVMPEDARAAICRAHDLRRTARQSSRDATTNLHSAAAQLRHEGWSMRDIAFALGLSFQRVQQLLATRPGATQAQLPAVTIATDADEPTDLTLVDSITADAAEGRRRTAGRVRGDR